MSVLPGKPMLAAGCEDLSQLRYPLYATPKVDGVRAIATSSGFFSRTLKRFPSSRINQLFAQSVLDGFNLHGLDGELIVTTRGIMDPTADLDEKGEALCNRTTSALMTHGCTTDLAWYVFDLQDSKSSYYDRRIDLEVRLHQCPQWIRIIPKQLCHSPSAVIECEQVWVLDKGYEGLVLRDPNAPYKFGRSTLREQGLVRYTAWRTSEAVVLGMEEEMENRNELLTNAQGFNKRSSHQENKVPKGRMGALLVRDLETGVEFGVGTGFDHAMRKEIWDNRSSYIGKTITYRFKPAGVKEKPRFPTFRMFRSPLDITP